MKTLDNAIIDKDIKAIKKLIPDELALIKEVLSDSIPALKELGYKDLVWW